MKAIVLCSGGMDSAVCAALAIERHGKEAVTLLQLPYGSRQNEQEALAAKALAEYWEVSLERLELPWLGGWSPSSLTGGDGVLRGPDTVVYGRNAIFLSIAAARAASLGAEEVWIGAHASDAADYPDCRERFVRDMNHALEDAYGIVILAPLIRLQKWEVARKGERLKVPWGLTYSCYRGEPKPCGICAACWGRQQAMLQIPLDAERAVRKAKANG